MELEFLKALKIFAGLVKFDLTDDICAFYLESLREFDLGAARAALVKLARSAKVGRGLPSIDEILGLIAPAEVAKIEDADNAAVVAGLIEQAMVRYGSRDAAKGFPDARAMIGELGWAVVGPRWQHLCDTTTNSDLPTLKSQWRQEVKGAAARARALLPTAPALPAGMKSETLALPGAVAELPPAPGSFLDVAVKEVARSLDRKSAAAGERVDDGQGPW